MVKRNERACGDGQCLGLKCRGWVGVVGWIAAGRCPRRRGRLAERCWLHGDRVAERSQWLTGAGRRVETVSFSLTDSHAGRRVRKRGLHRPPADCHQRPAVGGHRDLKLGAEIDHPQAGSLNRKPLGSLWHHCMHVACSKQHLHVALQVKLSRSVNCQFHA